MLSALNAMFSYRVFFLKFSFFHSLLALKCDVEGIHSLSAVYWILIKGNRPGLLSDVPDCQVSPEHYQTDAAAKSYNEGRTYYKRRGG